MERVVLDIMGSYRVSTKVVMSVVYTALLLACLLPTTQGVNNQLTYEVTEEQSTGAFVGNVAQDSGITEDYIHAPDILKELGYKFLSDPSNHFAIDNQTGIIRTRAVIDREVSCSQAELCTVKLDVAIILPADINIVKITVEIKDINDNAPEFPMPSITHEILESASPDISFVIPTALDTDGPTFGVQHYELVSVSSKFDLKIKDKVDGSQEVRLVLAGDLDREVEDEYSLQILAYDGGSPSKSGSVDIAVRVLDANDNNPVFRNTTYEVSIPENHPLQSAIVKVQAADADIGLNGEVQYSFSEQTKVDFGKLFGIRSSSGVVYVKGEIDYEEATVYHLGIIAQDKGPDSLPADATVIVRIQDLNDNAPVITVNTLTAAGTTVAEIAENSALGTFVAHITVEDKDEGKNGQFNCTLNDHQFELQHMYEAYKILTAGPLDRETRAQYNLALQCKDGGSQPQIAVTHLKVIVTDVNDHTPVFAEPSYSANILESNYVGAPIVTVNATDGDTDKNAEIHYELPDIVARRFHINSVTGRITAAIPFDREVQEVHIFNVIAKDQGSPPRSSMAQVIVTVQDINDKAPEFNQSIYRFPIEENIQEERVIGTVLAHDADKYPYNEFSYSILPSGSAGEMFSVDEDTGEFRAKMTLDREVASTYNVIVLAKDRGSPPMVGSSTVLVQVGDINDNAPVFNFPTSNNNTIHISIRASVGHVVTRLRSHDMDFGSNAKMTYYINKGNEERFFSLDSNLGIISLTRDISEAEADTFELSVTVRDHGSPPRSTDSILNIVVNATVAHEDDVTMSGHNFIIVITLACASGIVTIVLVTAIVIIRRQDTDKKAHKYNCRMEALKILATSKDTSRDSMDSVTGRGMTTAEINHKNGKKEVSFSVEIEDEKLENKSNNKSAQSWPSTIDHHVLQHPQACSSLLTNKTMSPPNGCIPRVPQYGPVTNNNQQQRQWPHNPRDVEVHQLLELLKQDHSAETQSNLSNEGSNTDSGRGSGASDEGDHTGHGRHTVDTHLPSIADVSEDSTHHYSGVSEDSYRGNQVVPNLPNHSFTSNLSTFSHPPSTIKSHQPGSNSYHRQMQEQRLNDSLFSHNFAGDNTLVGLQASPMKRMDLGFNQTPGGSPSNLKDSPVKRLNNNNKSSNRTVDTELDDTGIQYSCADMSDILKTRMDSCDKLDLTDKDDVSMCTTTSGGYVVDPQDLCDEIDELFFKDMVV